MFNIVQVKGDDAGGYYGNQANYYLGGNAPSRWVGQGAAEIGYVGEVDPGKFTQLMNGEVARDGESPQRVLSGVRKGWDMTISAPKWASVMITLGGDKRLSTHWQNAAQKAFEYVEQFATYRKTEKGRTKDIVGAKLIGGAFLHDANRNNEPSIHVHMVASAIGVTKDGKLRAVDLQHAYKHAKLIGQYVHAQFAHTARRDGYKIGLDDNGMAVLENAPEQLQEVSEALSTRRDEVRAEIDRMGVATRQGEVAVVRATRDMKSNDTDLLLDQARAIAEHKGFGPNKVQALTPQNQLPLKKAVATEIDGQLPAFIARALDRTSDPKQDEPAPASEPTAQSVIERIVQGAGRFLKSMWTALNDNAQGRTNSASALLPKPSLGDRVETRDAFEPPKDYPIERLAARHELGYQIRRVSERQAAFTLHEVILPTIISGLDNSLPGVGRDEVIGAARELVREGVLNVGRDRKSLYTATGLELEREQRIHEFTKVGKGQGTPVLSPESSALAVQKFEEKVHSLTDGQRDLVSALLSSKDRFVSVQGVAGTGKTTAIRAANNILGDRTQNRDGVRLFGVANTKSAMKEICTQGIEARTTASFLARFTNFFHHDVLPAGEDKDVWENTIILFDEASFAGNADMEAAMAIADKLGVRGFVAQGDRDQLPAIPAGNVPDLISKLTRRYTVNLSDIVRQTNPDLREAIQNLVGVTGDGTEKEGYRAIGGARDVRARVTNAVASWSRANAITDLGLDKARNREERQGQLDDIATTVANVWKDLSPEERAQTLVVFPTHQLRGLFHAEVRETLRSEGQIKGEDQERSVLRTKPLGDAEKDRAGNYTKGDVIVFSQQVRRIGARIGSRYVVAASDKDANTLQLDDQSGSSVDFNLTDGKNKLPRFEVFKEAKASFAVGDRIRILPGDPRNLAEGLSDLTITKQDGRGLQVTGTVDASSDQAPNERRTIELREGSTTSMMIDHDYSRTVYAAQGLSSLRVLAGFHSQSIMTSFANLYVIGSRAREALSIITDSLERAIQAVSHNPGIEMSAHTAMDHMEIEHFLDLSKSEIEAARSLAEQDQSQTLEVEQPTERAMSDDSPAGLDREQNLEIEDGLKPSLVPEREVGD
ncbi:MAG: MobF family relaxase [Pseudomonadota bacterium]